MIGQEIFISLIIAEVEDLARMQQSGMDCENLGIFALDSIGRAY
jgi:hypothetical protein